MQSTSDPLKLLPAVAVVGISAELPSGVHSAVNLNHAAFQEFLLHGKEAYEKIPKERLNAKTWKGSAIGQVLPDTGSFLKDISLFDHVEFGTSAKDARAMAVGTRKLLELTFLALLDSGIDYRSRNVGCYMSAVDFDITSIADPDEFESRGSFAGAPSMVANRVSYYLDLLGPSVPVDTACSSSLTAVHLAVQAIRSGECEAAVVGGCQVNHRLADWINYSQASVLSPDGKCKPFDASANGFGRGEGAVVVVLKLLDDAIRDGDHIYASILGTGINSSGSAAPVSAPVANAQKDAMLRAYSCTGRSPSEVDFIELHATGTAVGDPTETNWVGQSFRRDEDLLIGSVKGNIGHLEITAFLASLSKVCSIFSTGIIPPNVNFRDPNPAVRWDEYMLRVVSEPTVLMPRHPSGKALISITSSGIGGSNGHVVMEGPPRTRETSKGLCQTEKKPLPILLLAAGLSPRSASAIAEELVDTITKTDVSDLPILSTILGRRARQLTWRSFAIISHKQTSDPPKFSVPTFVPRGQPPLVFVFSGQGPQHLFMGRQLFASYPVFRESIVSMDKLYEQIVGQSLIASTGLFDDTSCVKEKMPTVWPAIIVLPAITIVQLAIVDLLRSINVKPDIVLGHSAGETAMLYACGAASKEMTVSLAIARGKAMSIVEEVGGTMAALSCSALDAQSIVEAVTDGDPYGKAEIACLNAPNAVTIAGLEPFISKAVSVAKERGIFAKALRTRVPVHCSVMDVCRSEYEGLVRDVFKAYPGECCPKITTYSTLTGCKWDAAFTPDYFWDNARYPVKFMDAVSTLLQATPNATFVEISPHPVLSVYISELGAQMGSVVCPMQRSKSPDAYHEPRLFLDSVGKLVIRGHNSINFVSLNETQSLKLKSINALPYPFARKHIPYYPSSSLTVARQLNGRIGPLNDHILRMNAHTHPELAQHVIKGEPIMPAAGYLEMALEYGARQLWNVGFHSMMSFSSPDPLYVQVELDGIHWSVKSHAGSQREDVYRLHADGYLSNCVAENLMQGDAIDIPSIISRCQRYKMTGFYESLRFFADYGPAFQRIVACYTGKDEVLAQVRGKSSDLANQEDYIFHPAILDSCFHVAVHRMLTGNVDNNDYFLPSRVDHVVLYDLLVEKGLPEELYVHVVFRRWKPDGLIFDFTIMDCSGARLCTLDGFEVAKHRSTFDTGIQRRFDLLNESVSNVNILVQASPTNIKRAPLFVVQYILGNEMDIKKKLQEISRETRTVWIVAADNDDGAAARGFSRSLRREISVWDIRLVLLPQEWTKETQYSAISTLADLSLAEPEIIVGDNGDISLPRFSISSAQRRRPLDFESYWHLNDHGQIIQSSNHAIPEGHVLVSIDAISTAEGSLRGFIGRVRSGTRTGAKAIGITGLGLSNYAVLHEGRLSYLDTDNIPSPAIALGTLAAALTLGQATLAHPARVKGKRILVSNADGPVGSSLACVLSALSIEHAITDESYAFSVDTFKEYDIILSGYTEKEDIQRLRSAALPQVTIYLWNDPAVGLKAMMNRHAWAVADALDLLHQLPNLQSCGLESISPKDSLEMVMDVQSAAVSRLLFDHLKTYLLVGGIGSLGINIAVWMYNNGARKIILTSRNGERSSSLSQNSNTQRVLAYLRSLPGLALRLECCDATSISEMSALLATIDSSIGGCMLLSVLLSDRTFFSQTAETYAIPFGPKVAAFKVLEKTINIENLDFFVAFSSISTFGNAGQTNYAGANTLVDELTRRYRNAFSLITPAILDSTVASDAGYTALKIRHLIPWGMTCEKLCQYIEDGIRKLADGPFWLYVPDLNWNLVQKHLGPSFLYDHLTVNSDEVAAEESEGPSLSLDQIILECIDVAPEDFSPDVALTSYGLDSLSAARLSSALRPFLAITQFQLLANISLNDLQSRLRDHSERQTEPKSGERNEFDWTLLNKAGETIVKLRVLEGVPLIIVHGASGDVVAFKAFQDRFSTPVWAIQTTPDTPFQSISTVARFYFEQIKRERPAGPYRIAGYCATSLITFEIVRLFEANGDEVVQLALIDHFPMLFSSPLWTWDSVTLSGDGTASHALIAQAIRILCDCHRNDPSTSRLKTADDLIDALNGADVPPSIKDYFNMVRILVDIIASFLVDLACADLAALPEALAKWTREVKAPITVYVSSGGMLASIPPDARDAWTDLGAGSVCDARVVKIDSGHFGLLESDTLINSIEHDWNRESA